MVALQFEGPGARVDVAGEARGDLVGVIDAGAVGPPLRRQPLAVEQAVPDAQDAGRNGASAPWTASAWAPRRPSPTPSAAIVIDRSSPVPATEMPMRYARRMGPRSSRRPAAVSGSQATTSAPGASRPATAARTRGLQARRDRPVALREQDEAEVAQPRRQRLAVAEDREQEDHVEAAASEVAGDGADGAAGRRRVVADEAEPAARRDRTHGGALVGAQAPVRGAA